MKKKTPTETESVKIKKTIVDMVRDNKAKTGVPINIFFEQSAIEKLSAKIKTSSK